MLHIMVGTEQELRRWSAREMKKTGHKLQHVAVNIGNGYQVRFVKEKPAPKRGAEEIREQLAELAERNFRENQDRIAHFCEQEQMEAATDGQTEQPGDQRESLEALREKAKDFLSHLRGQ